MKIIYDIECPYCGNEQDVCQDDGFACEPDITYEECCEKCSKNFALSVSWNPVYYTEKAECMNGKPHKYEITKTTPSAFSKMQCVWCDASRPLTDEEIKQYNIPTVREYFDSLNMKEIHKQMKEKNEL